MIGRPAGRPRRWPRDGYPTLLLIYGLFAAANLPLQQTVWHTVASDNGDILWEIQAVLLGIAALLLVTMMAAAWLAPEASARLSRVCAEWIGAHSRELAIASIAVALAAALAVSFLVLQEFPNSADEYAYLFQAQRFAEGRPWADAPPLGYSFVGLRTWISNGKWVGQYPPGWSLALALPIAVGLPAAVLGPVLGSAGAAGVASSAWHFPERAAIPVAIGVYALTPFYLLNAGSLHSHALSALLILALCLCCLRYRSTVRARWAALAGLLLGLIGMTRYYSLVLLIPALAYWWFAELRQNRLRAAALIGVSGLPMLLLLLLYHYLVTGDPLKSTYSLITFNDFWLSLAPEDIAHGLELTLYRLVELGIWTSPVLVGLYLFCLARKIANRTIAFYDLIFPSFVAGFILFPDLGGNRYGPRYYFDAFPLALATVLSAAPQLAGAPGSWRQRALLTHAVVAGALYILTACPFALAAFHQQVEERQEPYRLVQRMGLQGAIVVLKTPSGTGMAAEDLVRNDPLLDAPVLYARKDVEIDTLRRWFPDRAVWIYERPDPAAPGQLVPAQPLGSAPELRPLQLFNGACAVSGVVSDRRDVGARYAAAPGNPR
jgi:hypothetical protein